MFSVATLVDVSPIRTPCVNKGSQTRSRSLEAGGTPTRNQGRRNPSSVAPVSEATPHLSTELGRVGQEEKGVTQERGHFCSGQGTSPPGKKPEASTFE